MNIHRLGWSVLGLCLALLTACGGGQVVGVHVAIRDGGAATVTTRSLLPVETPGPVETGAAGVRWTERAVLACSRGEVPDLGALRIADVSFRVSEGLVRVVIPCGPEARWIDELAPRAEVQPAVAESFDPAGDDREVGRRVTFEVQVPGRIVASGATPTVGLTTDQEGSTAWVELRVDDVRRRERVVTWDVTWR